MLSLLFEIFCFKRDLFFSVWINSNDVQGQVVLLSELLLFQLKVNYFYSIELGSSVGHDLGNLKHEPIFLNK